MKVSLRPLALALCLFVTCQFKKNVRLTAQASGVAVKLGRHLEMAHRLAGATDPDKLMGKSGKGAGFAQRIPHLTIAFDRIVEILPCPIGVTQGILQLRPRAQGVGLA